MMLPSISIIIPVYNAAPYIERCLHSVCRQDYEGEVECILVDDGSTDGSIDRAKHYLSTYPGKISFRFFANEKNSGPSVTRNNGIKAAKNDYILFIDADDALDFSALSRMASRLNEHPEAEMVIGDFYLSERHRFMALNTGGITFTDNPSEAKRLMLSPRRVHMSPANKLISRRWILDNKVFFTPGILHEDELWTFHCGQHINSVAFVTHPTYVYFVNPKSITTSVNPQRVKDIETLVGIELDCMSAPPSAPELRFIAGNLIDLDSHLHHSDEWTADRSGVKRRLRGYIDRLRPAVKKAGDRRLSLSLLLLRLELSLNLSPSSRLFWLIHRGAKMFSLR